MTKTITASEFRAKCLGLFDRVAETGETIVVTKRGKPVVHVVPILSRFESGRLSARRTPPPDGILDNEERP